MALLSERAPAGCLNLYVAGQSSQLVVMVRLKLANEARADERNPFIITINYDSGVYSARIKKECSGSKMAGVRSRKNDHFQ